MMTQTHLLIAAAGFTRSGKPLRNVAAILGGLLPDLALYSLFVVARLQGVSMTEIFRERYWSATWQTVMAPGNSAPLFLLLLAVGALWRFARPAQSSAAIAVMVLAGAALTHIALDFPFHVDDGHPHLWPFTDWRFQSPVSYWDHRHYGMWVRPIEFVVGLICLAILFRRFAEFWIRAAIIGALIFYVAEPLLFYLAF